MLARSTFTGIACTAALALWLSPAQAQFLPKIPPAPAPKKEYVPPAPPKPVETKPPEPEVEVPSLVVKDSSGKLKEYSTSLEEAAIRGIKFSPEQQAKVNASIAARNRDIEKWAVDNLEKVKAAVEARKELDDLKDFNQLFRAKEAANVLQQEGILDRLVRDGAVSALLRTRVDRVVNEYSDVRKAAWEGETGADVIKIATLVGRQGFADQTRDSLAAVDRLIDRAGQPIVENKADMPIAAQDLEALRKAVAGAKDLPQDKQAAAVRDAVRTFVFTTLTPEQRKQLLGRFVAPAPEQPAKH